MTKKLKILATAKQAGSVNAIAPVARELIQRGHKVAIIATGNENEAAGFKGLRHIRIPNKSDYSQLINGFDYSELVRSFDVVMTGLSGYQTPDGYFLRAANKAKIPSIAVQDQDVGYPKRLGNNPENFPTVLAIMNKKCLETIAKEFEKDIGEELASRARVIGWVAFDHFSQLKKDFKQENKQELLQKLDLKEPIYLHFTQNIHHETEYMKPITWSIEQKKQCFYYEIKVTKAVFETASDMGLKLTVKPHPGEEFKINHTLNLVKKHDFIYLPAESCDTKQLMLASDSITAGRSTCLT